MLSTVAQRHSCYEQVNHNPLPGSDNSVCSISLFIQIHNKSHNKSHEEKPGELALSCIPSYLGGYRTVGWLEVEWLLLSEMGDSVAVLRPPLLGEGQLRRPNSCVIVLKLCQKPNKIIFKEVIKRNFFSDGNSISFIWLTH